MTEPLRCLTIRQPWAWATVHGGKRTENRFGGLVRHRGDVGLHAGHAWSPDGAQDPLVISAFARYRWAWDDRPHIDLALYRERFPGGVVAAVAELVDCHRVRAVGDEVVCCDDPWALARFAGRNVTTHTVWANVRPLPTPVRARGALGWWRLHDAQTRAVLAQLEPAPR